MNLDIEAWKQFAVDNWILIVVALVALVVVMNVVKTLMKWVLVAAIIIGIGVYGGYTVNDLKEVSSKATAAIEDQAIKAMAGEAKEAKYVDNADGSYSITTSHLELTGVPNTGKVTVKYMGQSLGTWDMQGAVRDFVVQARAAAK